MTDFAFHNSFSVCLLTPQTPAAHDWVAEHIPEDAQFLGGAVAIEGRYVAPILDGIVAHGLTVGGHA